jgi:hypothetical protein
VDWIVNIVGDCIYVKWWWIIVECIYTSCWWCRGEFVVWTYAFVVESYVHAFMTDGDRFYIQLRWLWCFCCIMGDDLEVTWYHMHIRVEHRRISYLHESWIVALNDERGDRCVCWIHTCDDRFCWMNVCIYMYMDWFATIWELDCCQLYIYLFIYYD